MAVLRGAHSAEKSLGQIFCVNVFLRLTYSTVDFLFIFFIHADVPVSALNANGIMTLSYWFHECQRRSAGMSKSPVLIYDSSKDSFLENTKRGLDLNGLDCKVSC